MYVLQKNDPLNIKDFKYVIIDTDCGGDDAQALILIDYYVRKQQKTLLGITCCDGNASIDDVIKNILIVQSVCGSNYPIYPGIESSIAG
jgi:inosine-uridine nucleoside N-ribohydrolase